VPGEDGSLFRFQRVFFFKFVPIIAIGLHPGTSINVLIYAASDLGKRRRLGMPCPEMSTSSRSFKASQYAIAEEETAISTLVFVVFAASSRARYLVFRVILLFIWIIKMLLLPRLPTCFLAIQSVASRDERQLITQVHAAGFCGLWSETPAR
jgi:hypothetical protein